MYANLGLLGLLAGLAGEFILAAGEDNNLVRAAGSWLLLSSVSSFLADGLAGSTTVATIQKQLPWSIFIVGFLEGGTYKFEDENMAPKMVWKAHIQSALGRFR